MNYEVRIWGKDRKKLVDCKCENYKRDDFGWLILINPSFANGEGDCICCYNPDEISCVRIQKLKMES